MEAALAHLGIASTARLTNEQDATVFAIDESSIARIYPQNTEAAQISRRALLLEEIRSVAPATPYAVPRIKEELHIEGFNIIVEARLPGTPLAAVLGTEVDDRRRLLRAYLDAARQLGELTPARPWYGDLVREDAIHTQSFPEYALARSHENLRKGGEAFAGVPVLEIGDAMPDAPRSLVHMQFDPDHVLVEAGRVAAVTGFGSATIIGDRRLEPVSAAIYLEPAFTPTATDEDRAFAMTWLESNQLHTLYQPFRRWLACIWCTQTEKPALRAWCQEVLSLG